jgi:hypothetical protein
VPEFKHERAVINGVVGTKSTIVGRVGAMWGPGHPMTPDQMELTEGHLLRILGGVADAPPSPAR